MIRFLYGRPLETLLATYGLSLLLIQTVRTIFGAQNVAVENPPLLSGGFEIFEGVVIPYNRIAVVLFTIVVVSFVGYVLRGTSLGLRVRAVTQNRPMAACMGIRTAQRRHVDVRPGLRSRRPRGRRALAARERGARPGPELHRRLVPRRRPRRRREARRERLRGVLAGHPEQAARARRRARCSERSSSSWPSCSSSRSGRRGCSLPRVAAWRPHERRHHPQAAAADRADHDVGVAAAPLELMGCRGRVPPRRRRRSRAQRRDVREERPPRLGLPRVAGRQAHLLRHRRRRDGPGLGLRGRPQPVPRDVLRARRVRDGHVPHARDR